MAACRDATARKARAGQQKHTFFRTRRVALTLAASAAVAVGVAVPASAARSAPAGNAGMAAAAPTPTPSPDAAAFTTRGPSAAADKVGSQIYVFWASTTGQLEEAFSDNGTTDAWKSASPPGMGTLYSQPTVATTYQDHGGHSWQYVFWEGTGPNHNLFMAYWNGSWNGPFNLGDGPLGSAPTASYDVTATQGNEMVVSWAGTGGVMWYTRSTNPSDPASWPANPTKAMNTNGNPVGAISGAPSASGTCNNDAACTNDDVFWQGGDNTLWEATYLPDTNQWRPNVHELDTTLGSAPSATPDFSVISGDAADIAWRGGGGDGNLWFWPLTDPNAKPINLGMGDLGSAPAITFNDVNGTVNSSWYFFWKGTGNNDLFEAYMAPGKNLQGPINLGFGPIGANPVS